MGFAKIRAQLAQDIKQNLSESAQYTPVNTLDTRTINVIVHRGRKNADFVSQQFTRVTVFADEVSAGSMGDTVTLEATGEVFAFDTVDQRDATRTIWTVKTRR